MPNPLYFLEVYFINQQTHHFIACHSIYLLVNPPSYQRAAFLYTLLLAGQLVDMIDPRCHSYHERFTSLLDSTLVSNFYLFKLLGNINREIFYKDILMSN